MMKRLPCIIVVIIDEFADLMITVGRDIEDSLLVLRRWHVLQEFI